MVTRYCPIPKMRAGISMKPMLITKAATTDTAAKRASCTLIRLCSLISAPLIRDIRRTQWISTCIGARHLSDRSPPLHLQFGQAALESSAGQKARVEAAQREIEDSGEVHIVTAEVVADVLLDE